jgi:hypothetical protein
MIKWYSICNVPINKILHDDKPAYVKEGHGGKPIKNGLFIIFLNFIIVGLLKRLKDPLLIGILTNIINTAWFPRIRVE